MLLRVKEVVKLLLSSCYIEANLRRNKLHTFAADRNSERHAASVNPLKNERHNVGRKVQPDFPTNHKNMGEHF
jgi:hypothetical protein